MEKNRNKLTSKILSIVLVTLLMIIIQLPKLNAQGSIKRNLDNASPQLAAYIDSLKNANYTNILPFLGAGIQKKGFEIPLPIGLMVNATVSQQNLTIDNLAVSFAEDGHYWYVSPFAKFEYVTPLIVNMNFRPDVWVFPFLNVSGLVGTFKSKTDVMLTSPFRMKFVAHNEGTIVGYGVMLAGGAGPLFATLSYNQVWSYTKLMLEPGKSYNAGLRIGHNHKLRTKPNKSWSVWVAVDWLQLNKRTIGKVNLNNLTGISQDDKKRASGELNEWYDELPPPKQIALKPFKEGIDDWLLNDKDTELYYDFVKGMIRPWSLGIGGQFKFNKHWQAQVEVNTTGVEFDRWRTTIGFNYRLGFNSLRNK